MTLRISIVLLAAIHAAILLAGFLAPYDYAEMHRDFAYAPPTRVHFAPWPFVYGMAADAATGEIREDRTRVYPLHFFRRGRLFGVDEPGTIFLWGADGSGRDVFSRVWYGGRISVATGLAATMLSLALGLLWGTIAGFYGGWADRVIMRGGELFLALPWLYLLLAVRAFLPLHIGTVEAFLLMVAIVGTVGWVRPARIIRGVVLSAREQGFVLAARGFGASGPYLIRRHILPLTRSVLITQATVLVPQYILAEVTLSFLGLGVGEPVPSWGNMLAEARQYHTLVSHAWMLAPGVATIPLLWGYLMVADALLEAERDHGGKAVSGTVWYRAPKR
jgi:peptide/nickel transport system permease protein